MAAQTPDPDAPSTLVIDVRTGALTLEIVDHDSHVVGYAVEGEPDAQAATLRRLDGAAGPYRVWKEPGRLWRCTCESFRYRKGRFAPYGCKHVHTLRPLYTFALALTKGMQTMTTRTAKKPPDEPQAVIVPPPGGARSTMTPEQVELIKRTICQSATDDELQLFLLQCARTGLDPFSRQIHAVKRWSNKDGREVMTIQVGIDGYRLIADRTGLYAGNDDPVFDDEAQPQKATVTVWKVVGGVRCPFTASARWAQYYPGDKHGFMWKKMPHLMLGKVAEALALRKAFPAELSGLYTRDELPEEASEPTPPITAPVIAAAPKTDGVHVDPASHVESAPPKADFYAGLMEYDRTLTGRGLIRAGALIAHVAAEGKRVGFPADLTKWTPDHAAAAREWTKAFVRDLPPAAVA